jgi:hypothetical protein
MKPLFGFLVFSFALVPVRAQDSHQPAAAPSAILLPGIGNHHHPISTANPDAQKFFDQGLLMVYGFNREEAVRSFQRAAELDPSSPMPYWGMALARGFHPNMDFDRDVQASAAFAAIQEAIAKAQQQAQRKYAMAAAKIVEASEQWLGAEQTRLAVRTDTQQAGLSRRMHLASSLSGMSDRL